MAEFSLTATAAAIEQTIRANRLIDVPVPWEDELIHPHYAAYSLRNVPHTVAALLGAPLPNSAPLGDPVWGGENVRGSVDRVVVFLMDGMGYKHLNMLAQEDDDIRAMVHDLTDGRGALPLTSVAPSTTAVALTTLWTGAAPAETGITGTTVYLPEFNTLGSMLAFKPMNGRHVSDVFSEWGVSPEELVGVPGLAAHLVQHGIPSYLVTQSYLAGSGLSRILHRGMPKENVYGYVANSDLYLALEDALRDTRGQRCYINVYWSGVDSVAHRYGAHNRYTHREMKQQLRDVRDLLTQPEIGDGRTMVLLLADHGHYDAPNMIDLAADEQARPIRDAMILGGSGDDRLRNLHLRPGKVQFVLDYITETYGDVQAAMPIEELLATGFYGTNPLDPRSSIRMGDVVLMPRLGWVVRDPRVFNIPLVSQHAGLSDWEMLIPLLWKRI